jgi:hypothetical protein
MVQKHDVRKMDTEEFMVKIVDMCRVTDYSLT